MTQTKRPPANPGRFIPLKPREQLIRELVKTQGADDTIAFYAVPWNGQLCHAVPPSVCMAILEYYAFEARTPNEHAANSYRVLARKGFVDFIYAQVGYNPNGSNQVAWKQFHDRVCLTYDKVPDGYFSIFKEIANIYVTLLKAEADLGQSFVPDISVGIHWSRYWVAENLYILHGERIKYEHEYPLYFAQSASNPQDSWCYPDDALAEFRQWFNREYLVKKLPAYLADKIKKGQIAAQLAQKAIDTFAVKQLSKRD